MKNIIKRLISLIICLSVIAPACVFAYTPGPIEWEYEFDDLVSSSNATLESKGLRIGAGGTASMEVLLPFTSGKIHFKYATDNDINLTIDTERNEYNALLSKDSKKATVDILNEEVRDMVFTLSADADVLINSIVFEKFDADISPSNITAEFHLSAIEEALLTTVAIHDNAVVLYDHGAMRYLDFDETRTIPKYFDDTLYIPAFALARSLDMYIEDYQDMEYVFLRSADEKIEIRYEKGETYFTTAGMKSSINMAVKYADGLTWLPVNQVAELMEKTVLYKNGITVIDFKLNAENVVNSPSVFSELEKMLKKYELKENRDGVVYHVAKTKLANDRNLGTEEFPFKTISKAAEVAKAGDTVIVHEGVYSEKVTPKNNGEPSKPIKFVAADGEKVVVSNFVELSGFAKYKDDIWCVEVPKYMGKYRLQVFYDGKSLTQGRHPNAHNHEAAVPYYDSVDPNVFAVHGDIKVGNAQPTEAEALALSGSYYVKSDSGLLNQTEKDYWKGATWTGLKGAGWYLSSAPVIGSEFGKAYVDDGGKVHCSLVYFWEQHEEDWGYLSNHINCVDIPGEWYYDGSILYIIPPEGVEGENLKVSVKQGFTSFDLTDKAFIEIHNINTRGASITMAGDSEHNVLNGGRHDDVSFSTFSNNGVNGQGYISTIEVEDDALENGSLGVFISGENNAVVNTHIATGSIHAMYVWDDAKYAFIYNNEISDCGYIYGDDAVKMIGSKNSTPTGGHQFIFNTIYNVGARGLSISNSNQPDPVFAMLPCEITYNHFYQTTLYARDAGAVYIHYGHFGHDREQMQVHHNLVHDSMLSRSTGTSNVGIYFDNCASGITFNNNLVYWTDSAMKIEAFFVQKKSTFPVTYSTANTYSNKSLEYIEEQIDMKTLDQMPNGKPFTVGADHATNGRFFEDGKFLGNYEATKTDYDSIYVSDAVLSDGAYMTEDGYAVFSNTGKITFKDVDLTGKNNIITYLAGSENIKDYVIRLDIINEKGEVVESDPSAVMITSEGYNESNEVSVRIMNFEGKHDLVFYMDDPNAASNELRLIRIRTSYIDAEPVLPLGSSIVYGGAFTGQIHNTTQFQGVQSNYSLASRYETRSHHYANWIFENTIIYEDVVVPKDYTDLITYVQATTGNNNYYMQIRIGSEYAEPIAEFDLNFVPEIKGGRELTGYVWRKMKQTLKEPLKAGTYDFYVTFEDRDEESPNTSDLAYFGFFNESDQTIK